MDLSQFPNDHVVHVPGYGEATIGDIRRAEPRREATEDELTMEMRGYMSLLADDELSGGRRTRPPAD